MKLSAFSLVAFAVAQSSMCALILGATSLPCSATSLTFDFSFTNSAANGGGTVQGVISGLQDNEVAQAATSVQVTSNTLGFGIGEYAGDTSSNDFDVQNGQITFVEFFDSGIFNSNPAETCCSLEMSLTSSGLSDTPNSDNILGTAPTFTLVSTTPVPAALPLFATGLGALGLLSWRRKRKAQAVV